MQKTAREPIIIEKKPPLNGVVRKILKATSDQTKALKAASTHCPVFAIGLPYRAPYRRRWTIGHITQMTENEHFAGHSLTEFGICSWITELPDRKMKTLAHI
jgi:hypothetical protein